jgi:dTDP-4-amino-4,6-dideoxygalactose transaminase
MEWKIPLFDIDFDEREVQSVVEVLKSKWLTMGEVTIEFERKFADFIGVKYAIAVSNGTAALHLAHRAVGIEPGDEVICPSLTFVATANSILYAGGHPIFADITSTDNFNISPEDIESKISEKTKAITVVHYGGYPCDMDIILSIAREFGLKVIEDSAHAVGAEYNGVKCGSLGDIGCFSFFSNKNMTSGEGGMVVTNNKELAEKIRLMRSHGMTTLTLDRHKGHAHSYDVVDLGFNYRIDEMRAALGLAQLAKLEMNNEQRKSITEFYRERLKEISLLEVPFKDFNFEHKSSYHIMPILLEKSVDRKWFMDEMKLKGVQTSIHYPPIHLFKYYKDKFGYKRGELPLTEEISDREVTMPLYPSMGIGQIDFICETIKEILEESI